MSNFVQIAWLVSIYALIFFVKLEFIQIFLTITMAAKPQYFTFTISDEIINCTILVTIFYAVVLIFTSLILNARRKGNGELHNFLIE